jgi:hypothetical protein
VSSLSREEDQDVAAKRRVTGERDIGTAVEHGVFSAELTRWNRRDEHAADCIVQQ